MIVFAPQVSGTIDLIQRPFDHHQQHGNRRARRRAVGRQRQDASRVFVIDGGSYGGASQVTIKDLTIEDGLATSDLAFPPSGGGILDLMAGLTLTRLRPELEPGASGRRRGDDLPRLAQRLG